MPKLSLQTRVAVACFAMIAAATGVSSLYLTRRAEAQAVQELRLRLTGYASTTALLIDGDAHEKLKTPADMETEEWKKIRRTLQSVQRALAADHIHDVYTMVRTEKPDVWQFVVDTDESDTFSPLGQEYDVSPFPEMKKAFNGAIADVDPTADRFGDWYSGYAPIRNSRGEAVAIVGIDAPKSWVAEAQEAIRERAGVLLLVALVVAVLPSVIAGRIISRPLARLIEATKRVGAGDLDVQIEKTGAEEIDLLGQAFNEMVAGLRKMRTIRSTFDRYVSREVAERILSLPGGVRLEGERFGATVLFIDLKAFPKLVEKTSPEFALKVMNVYLAEMGKAVLRQEGTLSTFLGDNVMAVFGAPVAHPDDALRAVKCAVEIQRAVAALNASAKEVETAGLEFGIGIATGTVVAGSVGPDERMEYGVVGDAVNQAAALEEIARAPQVLLTSSTYELVRDHVEVIDLGTRAFRETGPPTGLFEVVALRERPYVGEPIPAGRLVAARVGDREGLAWVREESLALFLSAPAGVGQAVSVTLQVPHETAPLAVEGTVRSTQSLVPARPGFEARWDVSLAQGAQEARRRLSRFLREAEEQTSPTPAPKEVKTGSFELPNLEVLEEVARGGMGVVYKAVQRSLNRVVAVKVVLSAPGGPATRDQRFQREVKAAARLRHPNIVRIYDVGEANGYPYFTMDYIQGKGLNRLIRDQGAMAIDRALSIAEEIADAMSYSHAQGVVHRDLKPSNILIDQLGHAIVMDFGLAKDFDSDTTQLTQDNVLMGSPPYMSPEQAAGKGQAVDARTDVYAIGLILYEMLAGRPAFEGTTSWAVLAKVINEAPPPLAERRTDLPVKVRVIVEMAIAKRPEARYQSAAEMRDEIRALRKSLAT